MANWGNIQTHPIDRMGVAGASRCGNGTEVWFMFPLRPYSLVSQLSHL